MRNMRCRRSTAVMSAVVGAAGDGAREPEHAATARNRKVSGRRIGEIWKGVEPEVSSVAGWHDAGILYHENDRAFGRTRPVPNALRDDEPFARPQRDDAPRRDAI